MTDQITTKPMRSRAQWGWAFATGQPFARRWAHETPGGPKKRYHKLPVKVRRKAAELIVTKPPNYGARAGQTIVGNLRRGASGQFERAGGASGAAPKKRLPRRVARGRRPPKTPEQRAAERAQRQAERAQERQAQREQNIAKTLQAIDLAEDAADSLRRLANGEAVEDDGGLVKLGLAEQARDGSYRLTAAGRHLMNAAERGDTGAARDAKSRAADRYAAGQERTAARQQRETERNARRAEAERRRAERERQSGGGSKKPERRMPAPRIPRRASRAPQAARGGSAGSGGQAPSRQEARSPYADLAERLSAGETLSAAEEQTLIRNGLARRNRDGSLSLTASGRRAMRTKAETYGGRKRSNLPDSVFAGPDRSFPIVTAQDVRDAVRSLGRTKHDKAAVKRGIIRRARAIGATDALPESWRGKSAGSFVVYKDASGAYRWVAYSSNAYRDRDQEIVSTKALTDDCARADKDGNYGPLRWWHVGGPTGPGWDLGVCDFNAMHGRVLIESGTFKSAAIGAAVAKAAPHLQMSIGFTHDPSEPDRDGVFHHIRRFERSLVPSGRAANPFTRLIVKETHMDQEKEAALKSTLGDEVAAQVLKGAEQTQKDADAAGVAYKSEQADPWAAVTIAIKSAVAAMLPPAPRAAGLHEGAAMVSPDFDASLELVEKAVEPPADAEAKAEPMVDAAMAGEAIAEQDPGEMTYDEFVSEIRAVVREELAQELKAQLSPIAGMLDIEKKVSGAVQSLMQPYQAQQATKDDARTQEIAALKERLAALEGDVPGAFRDPFAAMVGGYRASQATDTVVTKDEIPGGAPPPLDPALPTEDDPFADIKHGLFGSTNGRA